MSNHHHLIATIRRLSPRSWYHVDTRGQILIVYGLIWCAIGWNILAEPDPAGWQHLPLIDEIPRQLRAAAWIATGTLAILYAWRPRWVLHDGFGFLALYIMPAERVFLFFWGWVDAHTPSVDVFGWFVLFAGPGYPTGLRGAFVYLAVVAAVVVNAQQPSQPDRAMIARADTDGAR